MHIWSKFKKNANKIPNVKIDIIKTKLWKAEMSKDLYSIFSKQITLNVIKFITGKDYLDQNLNIY